MKKKTKKLLAGLLAVVMMLTLLPLAIMGPFAEEVEESAYDGPALNETIVGTLKFQSFNFLGKNETGDDGVDYEATFYYTDDYFSHSAINENVTAQSVPWTELDDTSLATTSMDLAAASYATGKGDVVSASKKTWANTDYSDRAANAREFLTACGFEDFLATDYDHAPTRDSVGYVLANKKIHVWDETSQSNKDFTLVAVGIRGAGYGSEWASNVQVGDPSDPAAKDTPHQGFDSSAQKVVAGIQQYISQENISGDVKYWVSGFSRAASVANLTAGYLTDRASEFQTTQKDIYGYTWECPQAAETAKNALDYKNIHNIVNAMDVVPLVSPSVFEHQRLGVDYVMPYYKNTTTEENTEYYNRMYDVLKTIAVGTTYKDGTYEADRLIKDLDPSNYPYNRTVPIYTITATQLISDAVSGKLMDNFGTVEASDNRLGSVYLDEFLNNVLLVCLSSGAWDRKYSTSFTSNTSSTYLKHKEHYAEKYQAAFMDAFDYFLDFSGPAFLDMIDAVVGGIQSQLSLKDAYFASAFYGFYQNPTGKYSPLDIFRGPESWWVGRLRWELQPRKQVLIDEAQPVVREVVGNMVADYEKAGGNSRVSLTKLNNALDLIVEVVIDLYADELSRYNSNYFGTTLHYLFPILSMHEQETVLAWITALDDNHVNRGYRTLTLPANTDVKLLEFRQQFEGDASFDGKAPVVAEYRNGKEVSNLDQRIYAEQQGQNLVVRYPASLDLRADITTLNGEVIEDLPYEVADYQTKTAVEGVSVGAEQYRGLTSDKVAYTEITDATEKTNAKSLNDVSNADTVSLGKHDTFQILANGTTTYDNHAEGDQEVYRTHLQKRYEVTWQNEDGTVLATDIVDADTLPAYNGEAPVKAASSVADYAFSGWTPEVTAAKEDVTYTASFTESEKLRTGHSLTLKGNIGVNFFYYVPATYNGNLELKFQYRGEEYSGALTKVSEGRYNYKAPFTVAAKEMTEPITAILTQDGEVINEHTYTVKRYADIVIANEAVYGEKLTHLAKAMLNYGGFAQQYFEYNLEALANADLPDYEMVSTDGMNVPVFDKDQLTEKLKPYGLSYYGANLSLKTETVFKIYFEQNADYTGDVTFSIDGVPVEPTPWGTGYYYIEVADIPAKEIGNIHTIQVGDVTFQYSALNYAQSVLNGNKEALANTMKALYDYYIAADAYFQQ